MGNRSLGKRNRIPVEDELQVARAGPRFSDAEIGRRLGDALTRRICDESAIRLAAARPLSRWNFPEHDVRFLFPDTPPTRANDARHRHGVLGAELSNHQSSRT